MDLLIAMAPQGGEGGGGSLISTLVMFLIIITIFWSFFHKKSFTPTLVLRKFLINDSEVDDKLIEIIGRPSGLTTWLLTILKLHDETSFICTKDKIDFKTSSLSGELDFIIPLKNVSSTYAGFSKPIGMLLLGIIFGLISLVLLVTIPQYAIISIIISLVLFFTYSLNKKIIIYVETRGGIVFGLKFKKSIIENINVDELMAKQALHIITNYIIKPN